jgi:anti-sigma-K factor RskA
MIFEDDHGPIDGGDDLLAAEYVVGVLPAEERRQAARRIENDPSFARLVEEWEARLSPLSAGYPEIEPPAAAKQAIDRALFAAGRVGAAMPSAASAGIWHSLAFWRGLSAAALALLVVAIAVPLLRAPGTDQGGTQFVASIAP